jgi:hypothetical protein
MSSGILWCSIVIGAFPSLNCRFLNPDPNPIVPSVTQPVPLSTILTMSNPIEQVEQLILAHLASQGHYPRPEAVRPEDVERVRGLVSALSRDIARAAPQPPRQQNGLASTITTLDRQMDTYERGQFLVSVIPYRFSLIHSHKLI